MSHNQPPAPEQPTHDRLAELERRCAQLQQTVDGLTYANRFQEHLMLRSPAAIYSCILGGDFHRTFVSPHAERLLGYTPAEFVGTSLWHDCIHPDDRPRVMAELARLEIEEAWSGEYRFRRKDGEYRWLYDELALVRWRTGEPADVVGSWVDITERKITEQSLRDSEGRYQALVEESTDGQVLVQDDRFVFCNRTMTKMSGYTLKELLAMPSYLVLLDPSIHSLVLERHKIRLEGGSAPSSYEGGIRRKDGTVMDVEMTGRRVLLHGRPANQGTLRDITARKRTEAEIHELNEQLERRVMQRTAQLHESETRFRRLVEQAADAIFVHDERGRFTDVNRRACEILGYTRQELLEMSVPDIEGSFSPADANHDWLGMGPGEATTREGLLRCKDGRLIPMEVRLSLLEGGEQCQLMAMVRDISKRKKAEEALRISEGNYRQLNAQLEKRITERTGELRESEANFRALAENALDAIVISRNSGEYSYVNPRMADLTGYTLAELEGMSMQQIIAPAQRDRVMGIFRKRIGGRGTPRVYQTQIVRKDGRVMPVEVSATRTVWRGKDMGMAMLRDISERQQAEDALRASEERYRRLFENSPISLWEEDCSEVKKRVDEVIRSGKDLRQHIDEHPEFVAECAALVRVLDVNRATVKLFQARRKSDLVDNLGKVFVAASLEVFKEELLAMAAGERVFAAESINRTLTGKDLNISLRCMVPEDCQKDWSRVLVSILDITAQRQAQAALKISEARYRSLFEDSPLSLWVQDLSEVKNQALALKERGVADFRDYLRRRPAAARKAMSAFKVLETNRATARLLGLDQPQQAARITRRRITPEAIDAMGQCMENLAAGRTAFVYETALNTFDGQKKNIVSHYSVTREHAEKMDHVLVTVIDITERKRAEQELRAGEQRFRTLVSNIPGAVYRCQLDSHWTMDYLSEGIHSICGCHASEFLNGGRNLTEIVLLEDRDRVWQAVRTAVAQRRPYILEYRMLHRGGGIRWVWEKGQGVFDAQGKLLWLDGMILDDTQRKLAEEATRGAHRQLIQARESERRRLAAELHDSVGQDLVVLHIALKTATEEARECPGGDSAAGLDRAVTHCTSLIRDVRNISHRLYPPTLQSLGLVSALRRLAAGMEPQLPIQVVAPPTVEAMRFSSDVEIALFRIAQESTHNAVRHSHATEARISLQYKRQQLVLTVHDNGRGFDPDEAREGLGLSTMRDRAEAVGGSVQIESTRGSTTVTVRVNAERQGKK